MMTTGRQEEEIVKIGDGFLVQRRRDKRGKRKEKKMVQKRGREASSQKANFNWKFTDLVPEIFYSFKFFLYIYLNNKSQPHKIHNNTPIVQIPLI